MSNWLRFKKEPFLFDRIYSQIEGALYWKAQEPAEKRIMETKLQGEFKNNFTLTSHFNFKNALLQ